MKTHSVVLFFGLWITLIGMPMTAHGQGKSTLERTGDIVQLAIPATAFGTTLLLHDKEGSWQFSKAFFMNLGITYALKYIINKPRQENNGYHSFPSGHTSAAFQGASFILRRWGWKYGLPAVAAATYVGWSRVEGEADKHDFVDVAAGAALGTLCSLLFTTSYPGLTITSMSAEGAHGVALRLQW